MSHYIEVFTEYLYDLYTIMNEYFEMCLDKHIV